MLQQILKSMHMIKGVFLELKDTQMCSYTRINVLRSDKNVSRPLTSHFTYRGAKSQGGSESRSLSHVQWNRDKLETHWLELFHYKQHRQRLWQKPCVYSGI